ncbi:amidohydrolase family protein [Shewanella zhangzhouensis]|uniref:amidohydrolase family protein n=1 Tax=Shewanella zhangzhouensis TaxID=2864213 RepID=UPI001C65656D|nr:amidohydrolase family protein [Shewanella zhangzhouensis]QYK06713.1 amidohydrolase [Shewanella zhangzhouensis]
MNAPRITRVAHALSPLFVALPTLALLSACAASAPEAESAAPAEKAMVASTRTLASFKLPPEEQACYDREKEPYTSVVDAHFHPRPFGGAAIPPEELFGLFDKTSVRFVNYFGIGQVLDLKSGCTYYLDCQGVPASPSIKNDFVNGMEVVAYPHDNLHITLSMTFMDLAHPENIVQIIELYDKEYPGMFSWSGELNVMKQALVGNLHEPATFESIDGWAPFMAVLRERNIPVTLHSDLGKDEDPTKYLPLMEYLLDKYPDNKIVWAHMGLSKELTTIPPNLHVSIMKDLLDKYPNLMLDISWDVLYNAYHQWGPIFIDFFNAYPTRILPGSDFVAANTKARDQYAKELDVTGRAHKFMDDNAFRHIALGENYFRLMNLDYHAPQVCKKTGN